MINRTVNIFMKEIITSPSGLFLCRSKQFFIVMIENFLKIFSNKSGPI